MELYGSGASIAQANSQTEAARQLNIETKDFNNSLAEQLDEANLAQDEDRSSKLQKNILSGTASAGKLAVIRKKGGVRRGAGALVGGYKEVPLSRDEVLAREAGAERAPLTNPPAPGEAVAQRPPGATEVYTGEAKLAQQEASRAGEVAGSATVRESAEAIEKFGERATKLGKLGVAGLGGGIDAFQDIGRLMEGKKGWDAFGSNNYARGGNIANIVGSSLEVLGAATGGISPWSLALEATGALIGLGGSISEGIGEEKAADVSKQTEEEDIQSQARGQAAAESVEQAVGRTQ